LNGLMGLMLGWAAFPAILVAVTLQLVFFGHGGLTTLGINVFAMAAPAILCYYLFHTRMRTAAGRSATVIGASAAAIAIAGGAAVLAFALVWSGDEFRAVAAAMAAAHVPVMIVEAIVTASVVGFLIKVRPEALRFSEPVVVNDERSFA
jgi:cobalt/nickel transport system permease protein